MPENMKHNELTYKQMQEMLPDYVFGRVTLSEAKAFEDNLDQYPDLREEVANVKKVFVEVEKMDLNKKISQKTRNLSIKVKNQINNEKSKHRKPLLGIGYVLPIIGIIVAGVIFYIYFQSLNYTSEMDQNYAKKTFEMVKPQELIITLPEETTSDQEYIEIASNIGINSEGISIDDLIIDEDEFNDSLDDYMSELLLAELNEDDYMEIMNDYNTTQEMYIPYDEIDEDIFQLILKDIENEEFI
jgi:hypothetical protein